jgi:hypothetical protein
VTAIEARPRRQAAPGLAWLLAGARPGFLVPGGGALEREVPEVVLTRGAPKQLEAA